jgi:hypothetical protein
MYVCLSLEISRALIGRHGRAAEYGERWEHRSQENFKQKMALPGNLSEKTGNLKEESRKLKKTFSEQEY